MCKLSRSDLILEFFSEACFKQSGRCVAVVVSGKLQNVIKSSMLNFTCGMMKVKTFVTQL